jgi:hypothetical protein
MPTQSLLERFANLFYEPIISFPPVAPPPPVVPPVLAHAPRKLRTPQPTLEKILASALASWGLAGSSITSIAADLAEIVKMYYDKPVAPTPVPPVARPVVPPIPPVAPPMPPVPHK